jgi:hypothetical protein
MDKIHVSIRHVVNFGIAVIIIDLIYFLAGVVPTMSFSGLFLVPSSWDVSYLIEPPDAKELFRDIGLTVCLVSAISIFGWAKSLIDENV